MANIPIWGGNATFSPGDTAFGFYDLDTDFQTDAPNVAQWCAQRLGYPIIDIELQDSNFFTAFEEAVTEYGHQVYTFQIINNMFRIRGNSTSSALNRIDLSDYYGTDTSTGTSMQGSGTSYNLTDKRLYSASLDVIGGVQQYNLLSHKAAFASTAIEFNSTATISSSIEIKSTAGTSNTFISYASSSDYHVSTSMDQFETGSHPLETAQNFVGTFEKSTMWSHISAVVADTSVTESATVNLEQRTEGPNGNTDVTIYDPHVSTEKRLNWTGSNFKGGLTGLRFERSGSAIQAGTKRIKIKNFKAETLHFGLGV